MVLSFLNSASDRDSRKSSSTPGPVAPAQSRRLSAGTRRSSHSLAKLASCEKLSSSSSSTEYIFDESDLLPLEPEAPDLRKLNNNLGVLATTFPDIHTDALRETLSRESRLPLAVDAILKNPATLVKGAGSAAAGPHIAGSRPKLSSTEVFRSAKYISAASRLARNEFKGLSRSTITAALAESNYSYIAARRTLVNLSSKSRWFALPSRLWRRSAVSLKPKAENHPLVIWKSSEQSSIIPCLRSTGNGELDRELYIELIAPLKERARAAQEEEDHALAITLSKEEAEDLEPTWTYECTCCFSTAAFEEFTTCNAEGHMICFRCVQHSITEATFGQGWDRSIDKESGTLRCPAVDGDECMGRIPSDDIHRAMLEVKKGVDILPKLDQRLAEHSLLASNLPLIRCPFCSYAEVDDPVHEAQLRVQVDRFLGLIFLCPRLCLCLCLCLYFRAISFLLPIVITSIICLFSSPRQTFRDYVVTELRLALVRFRQRHRRPKFTCQSPECGRVSCLSCSKEWADVHICNESSLVARRTQVEQAMSMAVKRVCPRCNTSFVKVAGCNKLTCPCGYKMCYVCRQEIGGTDGYRHFCNHFQPNGTARPCTQCKRCNLWVSENTEEVLRAAQQEAERKWDETKKRELSDAEKALLETGQSTGKRSWSGLEKLLEGRFPTFPEICDMLVENIFV